MIQRHPLSSGICYLVIAREARRCVSISHDLA
jgi:hypothetical protein